MVDTSWLIALHNEDDEHHSKALELAARAGPFLVPGVVLSEYLTHAFAKTKSISGTQSAEAVAREMLRVLAQDPSINIEPSYPARIAHEVFAKDPGLSYVDAVGVSVALALGQALHTFDEGQTKALKAARKRASNPTEP